MAPTIQIVIRIVPKAHVQRWSTSSNGSRHVCGSCVTTTNDQVLTLKTKQEQCQMKFEYIYIYTYIILHYYLISIKSIAAHKFPTTNLVHHPSAWHLPDLAKDWPDMQFQVQCLRTTCSAGVGSWPPWTQPGVKWTFSRSEMKSV